MYVCVCARAYAYVEVCASACMRRTVSTAICTFNSSRASSALTPRKHARKHGHARAPVRTAPHSPASRRPPPPPPLDLPSSGPRGKGQGLGRSSPFPRESPGGGSPSEDTTCAFQASAPAPGALSHVGGSGARNAHGTAAYGSSRSPSTAAPPPPPPPPLEREGGGAGEEKGRE